MSVVIIFIYSTCGRLVVLPSSELQASFFSFLFPVFFSLTICSRMSSSEIQSSVILAGFDLGIVFVHFIESIKVSVKPRSKCIWNGPNAAWFQLGRNSIYISILAQEYAFMAAAAVSEPEENERRQLSNLEKSHFRGLGNVFAKLQELW